MNIFDALIKARYMQRSAIYYQDALTRAAIELGEDAVRSSTGSAESAAMANSSIHSLRTRSIYSFTGH